MIRNIRGLVLISYRCHYVIIHVDSTKVVTPIVGDYPRVTSWDYL